MELRAANIISPKIEGHYAHLTLMEQISTREHHHDFFETFLILNGSIFHHINGQSLRLRSGTLVFIRPDDAHYYLPDADHNCELINLAFLRQTYHDVTTFLGLHEREGLLLGTALPPQVTLTSTELVQLTGDLQAWGRTMYDDHARARIALRAMLAQIIADFFIMRSEQFPSDAPRWLVNLCQDMQHKAHIVEGRDALLRLAHRSPEHIGRAFKTHLGITPSQFVNTLRLDYACELLINTDRNATDICFEVGFDNVSHFYRLFKARWACSPNQFRKMNRRTLIP